MKNAVVLVFMLAALISTWNISNESTAVEPAQSVSCVPCGGQ